MKARFTTLARREFLAEVAYYSEIQPLLGQRFVQAVEQAVARALAWPESGSPAAAGTRKMVLRTFPFSIFYRMEGLQLVIHAVANHARQPAYWVSRVTANEASPQAEPPTGEKP